MRLSRSIVISELEVKCTYLVCVCTLEYNRIVCVFLKETTNHVFTYLMEIILP